jgi:hypothetical protein
MVGVSTRAAVVVARWSPSEDLPGSSSEVSWEVSSPSASLQEALAIPVLEQDSEQEALVQEIQTNLDEGGVEYRTLQVIGGLEPTAFIVVDPGTLGHIFHIIVHHGPQIFHAGKDAAEAAIDAKAIRDWTHSLDKSKCPDAKKGGTQAAAEARAQAWVTERATALGLDSSVFELREIDTEGDGTWYFRYVADGFELQAEVVHEGKSRYALCVTRQVKVP